MTTVGETCSATPCTSHNGPMPIKKAVMTTGRQPGGTWVFNANTFISPNGDILSPSGSDLVWLNRDLIYEGEKIRSEDVSPLISLPLTEVKKWYVFECCLIL